MEEHKKKDQRISIARSALDMLTGEEFAHVVIKAVASRTSPLIANNRNINFMDMMRKIEEI